MPVVLGESKTLFNGVTRQPQHLRLPSQAQEGLNAIFSVETGGFQKRGGAFTLGVLPLLSDYDISFTGSHSYRREDDTCLLREDFTDLLREHSPEGSVTIGTHFINRDVTERYVVIHKKQDGLTIMSLTDGSLKTVTYNDNAYAYLTSDDPFTDYVFTSVADYTFIGNKKITIAADATNHTPAGAEAAVLVVNQSFGVFTITIDGTTVCSVTASTSDSVATTAAAIQAALAATFGGGGWSGYAAAAFANYVLISAPAAFTAGYIDSGGYGTWTHDRVIDATKLPARAVDGMIVQIGANQVDGKTVAGSNTNTGYYLQFNDYGNSDGTGFWEECAQPGISTGLDKATMPMVMVRNGDGTFTVSAGTWSTRKVGNTTTSPDPSFVGQTVSDLAFYRNRLEIVAGEACYFSGEGDYFNWYPEFTTQVLDSDPFSLSGTSSQVGVFRFATPFRMTLFLTADRGQYEVSTPDVLAPTKASINLATTYTMQSQARPQALGDSMFMASTIGPYTVLLEYVYNYLYSTNTAQDVSKHVHGYIPSPILYTAGDAVTGNLVMLPEKCYRDELYLYSYFYEGTPSLNSNQQKAQSAFHRWRFDVDFIWGFQIIDGKLYLVATSGLEIHVMSAAITRVEAPDGYPFPIHLDYATLPTAATYSALTDYTQFTMPYDMTNRQNLACVPSKGYQDAGIPVVVKIAGDTGHCYAQGDWSSYPVLIGEAFNTEVELSPIYMRDQQGNAVLEGRTQLRDLKFFHAATGYYQVSVQPYGSLPYTYTFDARYIGDPQNVIGAQPIVNGEFRVQTTGRADTTKITISNNTQLPMTISSFAWTGFYSSLQKGG